MNASNPPAEAPTPTMGKVAAVLIAVFVFASAPFVVVPALFFFDFVLGPALGISVVIRGQKIVAQA
jgi:hypothetical protein